MKFNYRLILNISLLLAFMLVSQDATSQIELPDDGDVEDVMAPIDGFITIAIAIGSYLGIRKLRK